MTETVEKIVHESEAQRQFVRVHLPAQVEFKGKTHNVRDLSTGGIGITDVTNTHSKGDIIDFTLVLPFTDFTLDINLEGQVQTYNNESKVLGARFHNLNKQQVSLLNLIIKSFISGNIVAGADVLNVVARDNFVRVRKQGDTGQNNAPAMIRQAMPLFFITLLGLLAALFIASNIFENIFVLKADKAVVESVTTNVRASVSGRFQSELPSEAVTVKTGDVIGTIVTTEAFNGSAVSGAKIVSPCDCFVFKRNVKDGETVAAGSPVVSLVPMSETPTITVRMEPFEAQKLKMTKSATIKVAGSDIEISGQIAEIQSSLTINNADPVAAAQPPYALVKIKPDSKLPVDLTGRPAQVIFSIY